MKILEVYLPYEELGLIRMEKKTAFVRPCFSIRGRDKYRDTFFLGQNCIIRSSGDAPVELPVQIDRVDCISSHAVTEADLLRCAHRTMRDLELASQFQFRHEIENGSEFRHVRALMRRSHASWHEIESSHCDDSSYMIVHFTRANIE